MENTVTFNASEVEKILQANPQVKFTKMDGNTVHTLEVRRVYSAYVFWADTWGNSGHVCDKIPDGEWTMKVGG